MTQIVTPYLLYQDVEEAARFLTRAFGFTEVDRQVGGGGGLHLELETDRGGRIYAGQPQSDYRNPAEVGRTSAVYVLVSAVDAHHDRARAAGATVVQELRDLPHGHRLYSCRDPQGHEWHFAEETGESGT
ncbi:MAG: VOC family protein [Actinomycetota bacterium]|nr:VOC family protein [Actinomycetota bacterium]